MSPLNESTRKKYDIAESIRGGIVITDVDDTGSGARAGLRPGDVITEINRKPVGSVDDFRAQISKTTGIVLLLVKRNGATLYVALPKKD